MADPPTRRRTRPRHPLPHRRHTAHRLNAAVRTRRLAYNPAAYAVPARTAAPERSCRTPEQAAAFLRYNATAYTDQVTDLFELMIGTGLRRREALGLHWHDVHLAEHRLYVRWSLTAIGNNHLHLGPPETPMWRRR
ncbi:hypothetical protein ACOKM3_07795 [Streptomyces sp. BH106]|uniref:hypothetical protein n=1 Tax=Streptomyces sp. BH106 TaxID=3410409 RepID=UPI003CF34EF6